MWGKHDCHFSGFFAWNVFVVVRLAEAAWMIGSLDSSVLSHTGFSLPCFSQVKSGPFAEHSNQLWNVSGVANWGKVNSGLIKMYKAEVS